MRKVFLPSGTSRVWELGEACVHRLDTYAELHGASNIMAFRLCTTYIAFYTLCTFHNLYQCHARFSDAGVPCYLRPSGDRCHYRAKPDSPTCTSEDDRRRLAAAARQLNRSIAVLEQKLIRLGVSKY